MKPNQITCTLLIQSSGVFHRSAKIHFLFEMSAEIQAIASRLFCTLLLYNRQGKSADDAYIFLKLITFAKEKLKFLFTEEAYTMTNLFMLTFTESILESV